MANRGGGRDNITAILVRVDAVSNRQELEADARMPERRSVPTDLVVALGSFAARARRPRRT